MVMRLTCSSSYVTIIALKISKQEILAPMQIESAAARIAEAIKIRERKEDKSISRFQLSNKSLSALCERPIITGSFMEQLSSEMLMHGWCCFQVTSSSFGFLKLSTAQNFRRFNSETLFEFLAGDEGDTKHN